MSSFFGRVGAAISGKSSVAPRYMLTDRGEEKLATMEVQGREFDILSSIKKLQPTPTVREIAKDLHWPIPTADKAVNYLASEGLIQEVG